MLLCNACVLLRNLYDTKSYHHVSDNSALLLCISLYLKDQLRDVLESFKCDRVWFFFVSIGELRVICIWEAVSSQSAQRTEGHLGYKPHVASEWVVWPGDLQNHLGCHRLSVCHSSLHFESRDAIKLQLCVQKKTNMNTSWYIKFKLILKRNKIQAQIQMFQRKTWSPSPLCSLCTPTQSIFCVFTWIFMETHM